jgi:hypothetical protein
MTHAEVEKKLAKKIDEKHILSFIMTNLNCKEGQSQWQIGLEQIAPGLPELLNYLNPENTFFKDQLFSLVEQIPIISRLNITNNPVTVSIEQCQVAKTLWTLVAC